MLLPLSLYIRFIFIFAIIFAIIFASAVPLHFRWYMPTLDAGWYADDYFAAYYAAIDYFILSFLFTPCCCHFIFDLHGFAAFRFIFIFTPLCCCWWWCLLPPLPLIAFLLSSLPPHFTFSLLRFDDFSLRLLLRFSCFYAILSSYFHQLSLSWYWLAFCWFIAYYIGWCHFHCYAIIDFFDKMPFSLLYWSIIHTLLFTFSWYIHSLRLIRCYVAAIATIIFFFR